MTRPVVVLQSLGTGRNRRFFSKEALNRSVITGFVILTTKIYL